MHFQHNSPISPFRTTYILIIAAFLISAAVTTLAQNSVPPTAVQAAKMPQFASRLAHPARRVQPKSQVFARATRHRGRLDSGDIYDNGPINGNTDAWSINFGFIVSDSFTITNNQTPITGMSFGAWLFPGDTLTSVEVSITSDENGGTSYFDQTVNFTQGSCLGNGFGFDVCTESGSFHGPTLNAGTYWVNLQNASVPSGDPVYWDENSGVDCQGQGCPSSASENTIGSIPSESFTILGNATTTTTTSSTYWSDYSCPPPQPGFHEIDSHGGGSDVTIGSAGSLYGTSPNAPHGQLYELAQRAGRWFYSSLYNFLGGSNGSASGPVVIGPEGGLYGAAIGGIQTCGDDGASYCGLIYEAKPGPTACATALCSWDETTIYQFTGNNDAWDGSVSAFDSVGNLYGISGRGGQYGNGAVFELSSSSGGWTEKILYSFTGASDGGWPSSLLVGHDGKLYGTAQGGGAGYGIVFQLAPSGGGWTENVLYAFTGTTDGYNPGGLVRDSQGNLFGFTNCGRYGYYYCGSQFYDVVYGLIFALSPSDGGWQFGLVYRNSSDCETEGIIFHALAIDATDNLYAAEGGDTEQCDPGGCYDYYCGSVLHVPSHNFLVTGSADIFDNLSSDANGNLYGTTDTCGGLGTPFRGGGMIWQYSPQ